MDDGGVHSHCKCGGEISILSEQKCHLIVPWPCERAFSSLQDQGSFCSVSLPSVLLLRNMLLEFGKQD